MELDPIPQLKPVEVTCRQRRHRELPIAVQQTNPNEIPDRAFDLIAFLEVLRIAGYASDGFGAEQQLYVRAVLDAFPLDMDAALLAVGTGGNEGVSPRDSLTILISTESLLFAAFAVSATLALPTDAGRALFFSKGRFAYLVVAVLAVIAVGGLSALWGTVSPDPPDRAGEWLRVCAIGLGIVVQPILAAMIAHAARNTRPAFNPQDSD